MRVSRAAPVLAGPRASVLDTYSLSRGHLGVGGRRGIAARVQHEGCARAAAEWELLIAQWVKAQGGVQSRTRSRSVEELACQVPGCSSRNGHTMGAVLQGSPLPAPRSGGTAEGLLWAPVASSCLSNSSFRKPPAPGTEIIF